MRSTPARMLHNGQLIVDRYSVSKIKAEPFRLPHNTVSVELINQMTGEESTRNLRWDEQVTTEELIQKSLLAGRSWLRRTGRLAVLRSEGVELDLDQPRVGTFRRYSDTPDWAATPTKICWPGVAVARTVT
jgi:hypothetical protein